MHSSTPYFSNYSPYYHQNSDDFFYIPMLLVISFCIFWLICKIFRIKRKGIAHFASIITGFLLTPFHPYALLFALFPFSLGFIAGRSTKIHLDPTNILSERIKISDIEYARHAEHYFRTIASGRAMRFFGSRYVHPTAKLAYLFQGLGLYQHARGISLAMTWFYLWIWNATNMTGATELNVLVAMLGLPYGTSIGLLWKYIKGHPSPKKHRGPADIHIGGIIMKPTFRSFILSTLYRLTPAMSAIVISIFLIEKAKVFVIIADVVTAIFCLYLLISTIFVHLQKIYLLDDGIVIERLQSRYGVRWEQIQKATVRERHNYLSGTDKLLILYGPHRPIIAYPISILSNSDQKKLLREVRRKIPTSTVFDSPTV